MSAETFQQYKSRILSTLGDRQPLSVLAATPARLAFWITVTGDECHGRGRLAVRDRDASVRKGAKPRGYTGHNLERNPRRAQRPRRGPA